MFNVLDVWNSNNDEHDRAIYIACCEFEKNIRKKLNQNG